MSDNDTIGALDPNRMFDTLSNQGGIFGGMIKGITQKFISGFPTAKGICVYCKKEIKKGKIGVDIMKFTDGDTNEVKLLHLDPCAKNILIEWLWPEKVKK